MGLLLSCRTGLGYNPPPPCKWSPAHGPFLMAKLSILVVAAMLLGVLAGCQIPSANLSRLSASDPIGASESSLNPLASVEKSLVFAPSRYPVGDWRPPGLAFEDAWFTAEDGTRLHGWYVPHPQPRAVVLFCHGNGGNVALWATYCGFCTIAWACRRWDSTTAATAAAKVRRASPACWPMPARPEHGWPGGPASKRTRSCSWAARWAGRSRSIWRRTAPRPGPGKHLHLDARSRPCDAALVARPVADADAVQFAGQDRQLPRPALAEPRHGRPVIPYAMGRQLFEAANEPKQFIAIPGGDHNDPQTEASIMRRSTNFWASEPAWSIV